MTRNNPKLCIIVPCYNEQENARPIYEAVKAQLAALPYAHEILFIDNKSTDRTREILRELCAEDPRVKAIFNVLLPVTKNLQKRR